MTTRLPDHITSSFLTYNSKLDIYNSSQQFLARGSKNVLINDLEKFGIRGGITLQSAVGASGSSVTASTDWDNSSTGTISVRALRVEARLEAYIAGNWETLVDSIAGALYPQFDPYWDSTEKIDRLLWVDGTADAKDWSGGVATLASIAATTVTLQGTKTFGQLRFLTTGTRAVRIKDDNGTWRRSVYTAGEASTTLTGLATDLTGFPFSGGNLIVQEVITRSSLIGSTYLADFLKVVDNQVWVGSRTSNAVYVSKNTSVADYSFSTPRAPGEGALLVLDGPGRAVGVLRTDVILFAGKGYVYKSDFQKITVGSSLSETLEVKRLKTTGLQGAIHQSLVESVGNGLMWVGNDNVLYELLDDSLAYNPNLAAVSDPAKPDFDEADFGTTSGTYGHLKFHKTRVYLSAPASSVVFVYEYRLNAKGQREWFWQAPQTLPVGRFAVIADAIHGHSLQASETYKLFDGYRDLDGPIDAVAELGRWNGGIRTQLKGGDNFFAEGRASLNTAVLVTYKFDKDGGDQDEISKFISPGRQPDTVYAQVDDPSLGNLALGDGSLSGDVTDVTPSDDEAALPRFRLNHELNESEFFDYGLRLESNDVDQRWEVMCVASNARLSTGMPTAIGV